MTDVDYSAPYWVLVETGHLRGADWGLDDVHRDHPEGQPLFSGVMLYGDRESADIIAGLFDAKENRQALGMKLVPICFDRPTRTVEMLEFLRDRKGVHHVTFLFSRSTRQPDVSIPIDAAIVGFNSTN